MSRSHLRPAVSALVARRISIALAAALALSFAWAAHAAASASAAAPGGFVGLQDWNRAATDDFPRLARAKVDVWRMALQWDVVQPVRGQGYDWSRYDAVVAQASAQGVQLLPILIGSPSWAASRPLLAPATGEARRAYFRFVAAAVERYGPGGTFWRDRPGRPIVSWQVWNEPNLPNYWSRPNPRDYARFLIGASQAIRGASAQAKVVSAGLPETRLGPGMAAFLRGMYRVRGAREALDAVAIHPFARDHRGVVRTLDRTRRVLRDAGDAQQRIWITAVGWASAGPGDSRGFVTNEAGQAARLRRLYRVLLAKRRAYRLIGAVWFSYRDPSAPEFDWWGVHTGLLDPQGRAKPAWFELLKVTG